MTVVTPAYAGGESVVGFARETTWGTPPTSGSHANKTFGSGNQKFMAIKEETFEPNVNSDPQLDDMIADREIYRIIANGNTVAGGVRCIPGPESIGHFLTMIFGTPSTSVLQSSGSYGTDEDVYQHIWSPGLNARGEWPAPYSFESRLSSVKSKLIMGALCQRLPLDIPNNGAMSVNPTFIAKSMQVLKGAATSGTSDTEGVALPCILTASPTLIDEDYWHWKDMKAYPQFDSADQQSVIGCNFELALPDLRGLFTGGSGANIGTYAIDKFQITGRATILFEDETIWYKIKQGQYFKLDITLEGDTISGSYKSSLQIVAYSCLASNPGVANKVGDLQYEFDWAGRRDPTEGKSCQITLINSTSSYAA